jgi:DNA-binding NtrC family response regulator
MLGDRKTGGLRTISTPTRTNRLLLVDDNLDDLLCYAAALERQGYDVRSVSTYAEGCAWLDREGFDLVIVSQGGADFEGREVLCHALERDRHTPVLVLTRVPDMSAYIEAMQMGAFDYLEKPLTASELMDLVAKHLRPHEVGRVAA